MTFEEICLAKTSGELNVDWNYIAQQYGFNGAEAARQKWKNIRKKKGVLPQKQEIINKNINNKLSNIELEKLAIRKEKIKLQDQRRELNKLLIKQARKENLHQEIINAMADNIKPFIFKKNIHINTNKEMLVIVSDWHVGLTTDNYWGKYNIDIFKNRINQYLNEIIRIGNEHKVRKITIFTIGDLIQGVIHNNARIMATEDVIKQTKIVAETLATFLYILSNNFEIIDYHSVVGNHGRVSPNKDDSIEDENFEFLIDWFIKERCKNIINLNFIDNIYDKDIITANICGKTIIGTHGDRDKATNLVNVIQNLTLMIKEVPYMLCVGHLHHYAEDSIHDVNVVMSGSLCGTDEYAKSIRRTGSPSQLVMIFNKRGKECSYNVVLD